MSEKYERKDLKLNEDNNELIDFIHWLMEVTKHKEDKELSLEYKEKVYSLGWTSRAGDSLHLENFAIYRGGEWILIPSKVSSFAVNSNLSFWNHAKYILSSQGIIFQESMTLNKSHQRIIYEGEIVYEDYNLDVWDMMSNGIIYLYKNWNKLNFIKVLRE